MEREKERERERERKMRGNRGERGGGTRRYRLLEGRVKESET